MYKEKTHREVVKEFLKDLENKKAYDALELEFKIHHALVRDRIEKKLTQHQ